MRLAGVICVVVGVGLVALAQAKEDDTLVRRHAGQIVISPDPVPTLGSELPAFVKANVTKDGHYELIKGSPWELHLVGFLAKAPGKQQVTLVLADAADPKATPIDTFEVGSKQRLTTAAGYEVNKTYAVRLVAGKTVLARAELKLRD
jgi:hypothetical protein